MNSNNSKNYIWRFNIKKKIIKAISIVLSIILAYLIGNKTNFFQSFLIFYYAISLVNTSLYYIADEFEGTYVSNLYLFSYSITILIVLTILYSFYVIIIFNLLKIISYFFYLNTYGLWFSIIFLSLLLPTDVEEQTK